MMFFTGGGAEAHAFIANEVATMPDPEYQRDMLGAVAKVIGPSAAGTFKPAFLAGLENADFRARAAAVYGLRHVNDPDVTGALLRAASDPSEIVRRFAIESLVARDADREELRNLIAHEPSEALRQVGECYLRLADEG
jgi:hypothetical protein